MSSENVNAKALLEQARESLEQAHDRMEEDTYYHEIVGSAIDDLDYVMHQTWPTEHSEPWQDGTDTMGHAADCLMFCAEVAAEGDGAPSTDLVREAADSLNSAATLLWGDDFTAALEAKCRYAHQFADREGEAEGIDILEATDQLTNAMHKRASEFPIASREDAIDALMDAAESTAALVVVLLALADTEDEKAGAALVRSSKEAGNANMQTLRAITYLKARDDGAEQADRDEDGADEEIAEAILDVIAKADMDEAKSRAKADAPTTLEEAMDLLNEAADMANWLHTAADFMADGTEDAREAASIAKERAMDVMTNIMAAYYYLNGGTFADRDHITDGEDLSGMPYVEVGYEDGSKTRLTGYFGMDTMADVARLMAYRNTDEAEEE